MQREWFVKVGNQQTGPFSSAQLKSLAADGQINQANLVSPGQDGKSANRWVKAGTLKGLFAETRSSAESSADPSPEVDVNVNISDTKAPLKSRRSSRGSSQHGITTGSVLAVALSLTCCFPVGLAILWTRPWTMVSKLLTTLGTFFALFVFLAFIPSSPPENTNSASHQNPPVVNEKPEEANDLEPEEPKVTLEQLRALPPKADLQNVDFRHLDLTGINFRGANLTGAIFATRYAYKGDHFKRATLLNVDFSNAILRNADFSGYGDALDPTSGEKIAQEKGFYTVNFTNADLTGAEFHGINFGPGYVNKGAKFNIPSGSKDFGELWERGLVREIEPASRKKVRDAFIFRTKKLGEIDLGSANLNGVNLEGADLRNANLDRANLEEANLKRANLSDAKLSGGADLRSAHLEGANLKGANLSEAVLRNAHLEGTDFSGANLHNADLHDARFDNANLTGASIKSHKAAGARFVNADLTNSKLSLSGAVSKGSSHDLEEGRILLDGANISGVELGKMGRYAFFKDFEENVEVSYEGAFYYRDNPPRWQEQVDINELGIVPRTRTQ